MRLTFSVLFFSTLALAGCGKPDTRPDPTKPIPWLQKPKDPKAIAAIPAAGRAGATARQRAQACGGGAPCDLRRMAPHR